MIRLTKGWLLATAATAFVALAGATPAHAAFCVSGTPGCTTGDSVSGGTFLGLVSGGGSLGSAQPDLADIAELKVAAGEVDDPALVRLRSKIETEAAGNVNGFTVDDIAETAGTFSYDGRWGDISSFNVTLKGGSEPASVWSLAGLTGEGPFNWTTTQELSNIQFAQVVPLPAAAWMFIGGLGIIGGVVSRRRRANAAAA